VGAVTTVPLGSGVQVRGGPDVDLTAPAPHHWPRTDTWVEVSQSGQGSRLRTGEEARIGEYTVSVLRCFQDGVPGTYESVAISLSGAGLHEASIRLARLFARPNAGLNLTDW
jgi:hypothetical protein